MAIAPLMGVCSSALQYDITDDGRVTGIRFAGGYLNSQLLLHPMRL